MRLLVLGGLSHRGRKRGGTASVRCSGAIYIRGVQRYSEINAPNSAKRGLLPHCKGYSYAAC